MTSNALDTAPVWNEAQLEAFTSHQSSRVRRWALSRLWVLDLPNAAAKALEHLRDPDEDVAVEAVDGLDPTVPTHAMALRKMAQEEATPRDVRVRAAMLLEDVGDDVGVQVMNEERRRRGEDGERLAETDAQPDEVDGDDDELWDDEGDFDVRDEELDDGENGEELAPGQLDWKAWLAKPDDQLASDAASALTAERTDEIFTALQAMEHRNARWIAPWVTERIDALFRAGVGTEALGVVCTLGDPRGAALLESEWRPGEPRLAAMAADLSALGGGTASEAVEQEVAAGRRAWEATRARLAKGTKPVRAPLMLACTRCHRVFTYEVMSAYLHPDLWKPAEKRSKVLADWDGVTLGRIITCKRCGAVDSYELTKQASLALTLQSLGGDEDFAMGEPRLFDGTALKRPSQGLAHLRELAARAGGEGEPWRRLGNLALRYELEREGEEALRKAMEDPNEGEAPLLLVEYLLNKGRHHDAVVLAPLALARSTHVKASETKHELVKRVCHVLEQHASSFDPPVALMATWSNGRVGNAATVSVSSVDLRDVRSWPRLAELVAGGTFHALGVTSELPEDKPTLLQRLLEARPKENQPIVRSAKQRPNEPCACGSGRKFKRCCRG